jgi:hypothetical protein
MRLAGLVARRLAPTLFDNRWFKPGSGRGTLPGSHLFSRRPRFGSLAAGTGVRRRPAISWSKSPKGLRRLYTVLANLPLHLLEPADR